MPVPTVALVGAVGGAGTTRTSLELATALAADGDDVALIDAAYDTQGLARHLPGRLDPDVTTLVTDGHEQPLSAGLTEFDPIDSPAALETQELPNPGRIACCPARAPFERLARAKASGPAQELERRIDEAATAFDRVLVDVPPLGSNPAVAAVTAAEHVAIVTPATADGVDAVQTTRGRLQDVGTEANAVFAVDRGGEAVFPESDADVVIPEFSSDVPAALETATGVRALTSAAETVFDCTLDFPLANGGLVETVSSLRSDGE